MAETEPHYEVVITPLGNQSEVRIDGERVPRLYAFDLHARVGEPTRIILRQFGEATIVGTPGEAVLRHDCPDCPGHPR